MHSLLSDGASAKPYDLSGSYGVGHLAPMALSNIRYLLYGGKTKSGRRVACGRTVLASHPGDGALMTTEGYLIKGFKSGLDGNLYEFLGTRNIPPIIQKYLNQIVSQWGHGCAVLIPGFNHFGDSSLSLWDIVSKVAAYNFCPSIYHGKLVIEVRDDEQILTLDQQNLTDILEQEGKRERAYRSDSFFANLRPSGPSAYSILQTLVDGETNNVTIDGSAVQIGLLVPSSNGQRRVDLFRNGMWITDDVPGLQRAEFTNQQPFHAVIEVDGKDDSALHRLVRKAEGPMHNEMDFKLLSHTERQTIRGAIAQISQWLKDKVPPIGNEEFTVDDFLLVKSPNDNPQGKESFSFWGIPTPVVRRDNRQVYTMSDVTQTSSSGGGNGGGGGSNGGGESGGGGKQSPQHQRARRQPFKSVVVPDGTSRISASITPDSDLNEVIFTLRVDENTDFTCDRLWQDDDVAIKSFTMKDPDGNTANAVIEPDGLGVRVSVLDSGKPYAVQVEYETPQDWANTVGVPVLRLELLQAANPPKPKK